MTDPDQLPFSDIASVGAIWPFETAFTETTVIEHREIMNGVRAISVDIGLPERLMYLADDAGYPLRKEDVQNFCVESRPSGRFIYPVSYSASPGPHVFHFFYISPGSRHCLRFVETNETLWVFGKTIDNTGFGMRGDPPEIAQVWSAMMHNYSTALHTLVSPSPANYVGDAPVPLIIPEGENSSVYARPLFNPEPHLLSAADVQNWGVIAHPRSCYIEHAEVDFNNPTYYRPWVADRLGDPGMDRTKGKRRRSRAKKEQYDALRPLIYDEAFIDVDFDPNGEA